MSIYVKRSSFFSALSKNLPSALRRSHTSGVMLLIGQMSVGEILFAYLILSVLSELLIRFTVKAHILLQKRILGFFSILSTRKNPKSLQVMRSIGTSSLGTGYKDRESEYLSYS